VVGDVEVDEPEETEVVDVAAETELPLVVELADVIVLYVVYPT
jgi:pyruvate dehydrogenase complex dehydrogenase (E1) component